MTDLPLRLGEPVLHIHSAVQGGRDREVFLCLGAVAGAAVELAQAEVTVTHEPRTMPP